MALGQKNFPATDQSLSLGQFNGTKTVCRPLHFRSCPLTLRLLVQLMAPRTLSPLLRLASAGSRRSGRLTWCVASLSHASHCPSLGCRLQLLLVALLSHCPLSLPISHCRLHCKPVELACLSHCLSLSLSLSLPLPVTLHVSQSLTAPQGLGLSLVRVCGTNNWPAAGEKSQTFNEAGIRRGAPWEDSAWRGDSWTISDSESAILTARLLLFR